VSVARGGNDLEHAVVDLEDGHIEGATAKVEHENVLLASLLVEPVCDSGRGGLVDDASNVQTSDDAGVLGSLALSVVEIG
jgi:hypothetical protein